MGSLIIFQCLDASVISRSVSFALPAVIGGTVIALLSQSTGTHGLQLTVLPSRGFEEHYSR